MIKSEFFNNGNIQEKFKIINDVYGESIKEAMETLGVKYREIGSLCELSEEEKNDIFIYMRFFSLKQKKSEFKFVPKNILYKEEFIISAIKNNPYLIKILDLNLLKNDFKENIINYIINSQDDFLNYLPIEYRKNKDYVIKSCLLNPINLQFVDEDILNEFGIEIIKTLIKKKLQERGIDYSRPYGYEQHNKSDWFVDELLKMSKKCLKKEDFNNIINFCLNINDFYKSRYTPAIKFANIDNVNDYKNTLNSLLNQYYFDTKDLKNFIKDYEDRKEILKAINKKLSNSLGDEKKLDRFVMSLNEFKKEEINMLCKDFKEIIGEIVFRDCFVDLNPHFLENINVLKLLGEYIQKEKNVKNNFFNNTQKLNIIKKIKDKEIYDFFVELKNLNLSNDKYREHFVKALDNKLLQNEINEFNKTQNENIMVKKNKI